MIQKYYVVKQLINTTGQDAPSISVYDPETAARMAYHQTCANFHNAADVYYGETAC